MPQMNPMNWLMLLFYFNSLFFFSMSKIHFSNLFAFTSNLKKKFTSKLKMNIKF